jgi:hypothetical protein
MTSEGSIMTKASYSLGVALLATCSVGLPACRKNEKPADRVAVSIPDEAVARVNAKLAAADALDGKSDKVVAKCAGCALSMDGKREIVLAVTAYDLRFCSEHCRENFAPVAADKLLALEVAGYKEPDPEEAEDEDE